MPDAADPLTSLSQQEAEEFAIKMHEISTELITQLTLAQAEYEDYANRYRMLAPRYKVNDLSLIHI